MSAIDPQTRTAARLALVSGVMLCAATLALADSARAATFPDAEVRDKVEGAWVGGLVGAAWGFPVEFRFNGRIVPKGAVPRYSAAYANRFAFRSNIGGPDDLYVEIPFLSAMEDDVLSGWPEWGDAFKRTRFKLFAENDRARTNLRRGIAAPASGDFSRNPFAHNVGWQVESDWAGTIAPAQPGAAVDISWRAGHVVGYGDGVYGGVLVSAMHAAAYQADDVEEIVEAGRDAIPESTGYRKMVDHVIGLHQRFPGSWRKAWRRIERRWNAHKLTIKRDPRHVKREFNIDAKLNGAYVLLGLLYGDGSFGRSLLIAMRAGQDADSNPANVGSVLGNWLGFSGIPRRYTDGIAMNLPLEGTDYSLNRAIEATVAVAREVTLAGGGSVTATSWDTPTSPLVTPPVERWPRRRTDRPRITATATVSGLDVAFSAAAEDGDGIRDIHWSFGDLRSSPSAAPDHTYPAPGSYRAVVWAVDGRGRTSSKVLTVSVG